MISAETARVLVSCFSLVSTEEMPRTDYSGMKIGIDEAYELQQNLSVHGDAYGEIIKKMQKAIGQGCKVLRESRHNGLSSRAADTAGIACTKNKQEEAEGTVFDMGYRHTVLYHVCRDNARGLHETGFTAKNNGKRHSR